MPIDFVRHLLQQPLWVQVWVAWLGLVNFASVAFLQRKEGRVVLAVFVANMICMSALFALNGFNRLLGLSHVLWWTPLLVYLVLRLKQTSSDSPFGKWMRILVATNALSLVLDYSDVVRFLLGDRS